MIMKQKERRRISIDDRNTKWQVTSLIPLSTMVHRKTRWKWHEYLVVEINSSELI